MVSQLSYSSSELLIINSARLLQDGDVVFVGVGLPNLACNLAKRTHAPNLLMIYEAGIIGAHPSRLPLSIGDPTLVSGALSVCSMYDIFTLYLQRGNVDVGFLGGAQIDRYGNINATVIGEYGKPKVRLPGSGGSKEIAAWANRCYVMTFHQKRRFPEKVDFMTSAGSGCDATSLRYVWVNWFLRSRARSAAPLGMLTVGGFSVFRMASLTLGWELDSLVSMKRVPM